MKSLRGAEGKGEMQGKEKCKRKEGGSTIDIEWPGL